MGSKLKFAISTFISVIFAIAIFLFILMISQQNHHEFDLTKNHFYSLAEQSRQAVTNLKEPVQALVFMLDTDIVGRKQASDLLDNYKAVDPKKFSYRFIDPKKAPIESKKYDIRMPGQVVLVRGDKQQRVMGMAEEEMTNGLLAMTEMATKKLYFLSGHDELNDDQQDPRSVAQFKASLVKDGYLVADLNLSQQKAMPTDTAALVVAGPRAALLENEQKMLDTWMAAGGRMMLLLEDATANKFDWLLAKYAMKVPEDIILDQTAQMAGAEPVLSVGLRYSANSAITRNFKVNTMFLLARPVMAVKDAVPEGATVEELVSTSEYAVSVPADKAAQASSGGGQISPDMISQTGNIWMAAAGSYPVASNKPSASPNAVEPNKPSTRLVVVGDADFVSNQLLEMAGNKDFGMNCINWLTESENKITIRPKDENSEPVVLSGKQEAIIKVLLVLAIPAIVFLMGLTNARRRR